MSRTFRTIFSITKWAVVAIVLLFVVIATKKQFSAFDWRAAHYRVTPIALATLFLIIIYAARTLSFRLLLSGYAKLGHGVIPTWRGIAVVAWVPQLAKYVPGQVVSVLGAVGLLRKFGVPAAIGLSVVLVMDGLAVLTGLVSGSPLLLWSPVQSRFPHVWILCIIVIVAGAIALSPPVMGWLINLALTKARKTPLKGMPALRDYVGPVLLGFGQWILAGLALWCTALSVTDVPMRWIPLFIAIGALGYTAGYVSPLPGGFGLREGVFLIALPMLIGPAAAITAATLRIVQTIVELLMAGAGLWIYRRAPSAS